MMMNQQIENLENKARLLAKLGAGALTPDELRQLDALMSEDARYEDIKKRLGDAAFVGSELAAMQQIDGRKAWADMQQRIASEGGSGQRSARRIRLFPHLVKRIAAVVLLFLLGGACWYHYDYTRVTPPEVSEAIELAMRQSRESGRSAAEVESITTRHSQPISREERVLYHVDDDFAEQLTESKRITTYQDKEFWVTLDDGTLVHLNNNSRLIYPERFGDRRDVILDGEAYFMVAKDKSRQFVVHTPQGDIRVYGTEFWVNTRVLSDKLQVASEKHDYSQGSGSSSEANRTSHLSPATSQLILVRGSVSFTPTEGDEQMLRPGQQLSVVNSQLAIKDVDTTPYEAWNTGLFVFENTTLEHLLSVMAQWYDIKAVNYTNDSLRKIHFTGNLKRYGSAERIMKAIMMACEVKIVLQNDTLLVSN